MYVFYGKSPVSLVEFCKEGSNILKNSKTVRIFSEYIDVIVKVTSNVCYSSSTLQIRLLSITMIVPDDSK